MVVFLCQKHIVFIKKQLANHENDYDI